jgi:AbrB family looped-hinge helix DNA binding protein
MTLIRIKANGQITLPIALRKQAGIKAGDWLVISVRKGAIALTPLSRFAPTPRVLRQIQEEAKRKGTNRLTMRQIDQEIRAYRKDRKRQ